MTGEYSGKWPDSGAGDECTGLLKNLRREEILEVLSGGEGFCRDCQTFLQTRIHSLINSKKKSSELSGSSGNSQSSLKFRSANSSSLSLLQRSSKSSTKRLSWNSIRTPEPVHSRVQKTFANSPPESVNSRRLTFHHSASETSLNDGFGRVEQKQRIRFAQVRRKMDFVHTERIDGKAKNVLQGLELHDRVYSGTRKRFANSPPASVNRKRWLSFHHSASEISLNDGLNGVSSLADDGFSEDQEHIRFAQIGRKKDFVHIERIDGHAKNVLQGLELHTQVFNPEEQRKIVKYIYGLQRMGQNGQLGARTYSEPKKWMRGKGRVTIQFGCCYNYAVDKNGNPPGIIRDEKIDPLPSLFKQMIKRMVRWHVLPPSCVPNSCIVNIYDEGDCIPPHIDHHDFLRPFCTVSLLSECNILFGANLKVVSPGEFDGPISIPLPIGSVLILNGNGADVAKHCIPGVLAKRISITFRKMDDNKLPYSYSSDPELVRIKSLVYSSLTKSPVQQNQQENNKISYHERIVAESCNNSFFDEEDDFSPPGGLNPVKRPRADRNGWRQ